jgi:hypothetical protein
MRGEQGAVVVLFSVLFVFMFSSSAYFPPTSFSSIVLLSVYTSSSFVLPRALLFSLSLSLSLSFSGKTWERGSLLYKIKRKLRS